MNDVDHSKIEFAIKPGIGFGEISFGSSAEQISAILPWPCIEGEDDYGPGNGAYRFMNFFQHALSFSFDSEFNYRLNRIEIDQEVPVTLGQVRLFDLSEDELVRLIKNFCNANGLSAKMEHADEDRALNRSIDFTDISMILYFDRADKLVTIQLGLFIDPFDKFVWPPPAAALTTGGMLEFYKTYRGLRGNN